MLRCLLPTAWAKSSCPAKVSRWAGGRGERAGGRGDLQVGGATPSLSVQRVRDGGWASVSMREEQPL